jgi:Zn-dependent alcohol dehydrogenase
LQLAEEVGATHTINTTVLDFDFQQAVRHISPNGPSIVFDTTGVGKLIEEAFQSLAPMGKLVHIASPAPDYRFSLDITALFTVSFSFASWMKMKLINRPEKQSQDASRETVSPAR